MRYSHLLAILVVFALMLLALAAVAQPALSETTAQVSPATGKASSERSSSEKSATSLSTLPPNARAPILSALAKDGALDPLVVDPWVPLAQLTSSDGVAGDAFGFSVAVDGNTAVVTSSCHPAEFVDGFIACGPGAAYVFVKTNGTWTQQAELTASDGAVEDAFGLSVAVSGGTVVVGAPWHNSMQGAAYVFVQNGTSWSQQAELTASDGAADEEFGLSVGVSGSTVVAGDACHPRLPSAPYCGPGAAYVFVQNGSTWSQQAELTASDGAAGDDFGVSVAVSGSTVVVGAPDHEVGPNRYQGAAYVFVQSGTTWTQQAELTASDGVAYDQLSVVALDGGTAVVGAPHHPYSYSKKYGDEPGPGAAYVFVQNGTAWSQQAELTTSDGVAGDFFGVVVAVNGGTAVVSAPDHIVNPTLAEGTGYVFAQSGNTWSQQQELIPPTGALTFYSFAVSGGTLVAGASDQTIGSNEYQGSAYVFEVQPVGAVPNVLYFSNQVVATPSAAQSVTLTNGSAATLNIGAIGINGPYAIATNTCGATLTAGYNCTVGLTFTPTAMGVQAGTLTFTDDASNSPQTVGLAGTGLSPIVNLSAAALTFGDVAVGSASTVRMLTLWAFGTSTLNISSIVPSANFALSSTTCGATLATGKNCKLSVTFTPTTTGALTGTLTFTDNALNSPQTVALSGTGIADATLGPATQTYVKRKVGTTSTPQRFTLVNSQPVALTGIAISTTGDFALSTTTCGTSLAAKSHCAINVTFSPTQTGTLTGQLSITDSASNSLQTSTLTGTGD